MSVSGRACVKTHTSAKCRKHNSPARHRTSLVQYDLTPTDAIAQRYFYVWRDRWSFRTAKTIIGRIGVEKGDQLHTSSWPGFQPAFGARLEPKPLVTIPIPESDISN